MHFDCESAATPKNVGRLTCLQTLPDFCMGRDEGYHINELGSLGSIWLKKWKSGRIENDGRMEKWENIKDFNFSHFCLVFFFLRISFLFSWEWKSGGMRKMSLYKFSHTPLLKNNGQLIQKVTNNQKKKGNHPIY